MGVHVANVRDTIQFALPLENDYVYTNLPAGATESSVWETIPAGARTVVMILPSASGGDGAGDPQSGPVSVQFRC
jgi:hypothetical protein